MRDNFRCATKTLATIILLVLAVQGNVLKVSAQSPREISPPGRLGSLERSNIDLFEKVSPSVVQVAGLKPSQRPTAIDAATASIQSGTGFIWDPAGYVVTNSHVVQGTASIVVRLSTGEVVTAKMVGVATNYDLAVIRLQNAQTIAPAIPIGTSASLRVGQFAFAIGNPFGLDQSLTMGIISALKRRLPTEDGREISNVIQTDAAINPGNSGGPLLDSAGRLIGVNTAIVSPAGANIGVGFAIPVDTVNRIVPQLIQNGRVPVPGVGIVPARESVAFRLGIEGVIVARTTANSPAARAGIKGINATTNALGDVVVGVNSKPVRSLSDLTDELEQAGVGQRVRLSLKRNGQERTVEVDVIDIGDR